jgi:hypothetical protein
MNLERDWEICSDATEVLVRWLDSGGTPYCVPCSDCEWREGDGQFSRINEPGRPVCPKCQGTGMMECASLHDSPWVVDDFTACLANLHLVQWEGRVIRLNTEGGEG